MEYYIKTICTKGAFIFRMEVGGGGWPRGIPISTNVKSPILTFILLLKNVTLLREAVKFIVTHLFFVLNLC